MNAAPTQIRPQSPQANPCPPRSGFSTQHPALSTFLFPAIIALAALMAYANTFHGPFVCDDVPGLVENPTIRNLWPLSRVLAPPRWGSSVEGRPIANLTFALNFAIHRLNVTGYHVTNLLIHILTALTLYGLVRRTLLLASLPNADTPIRRYTGTSTAIAFAIAVLWSLHPLCTQAVTYIIQRAESLAALFYLLTLYCLARSAMQNSDSNPDRPSPPYSVTLHRRLWSAAAVAACALGMASKEVMVSAPLLALAYDRIFLSAPPPYPVTPTPRHPDTCPSPWRAVFRARKGLHAALASTWLLMLFIQLKLTGFRSAQTGFNSDVSPWHYLLTQSGVILHYLKLAFWPRNLCFDYSDWPLAHGIADVWPSLLAIGLLLAATLVALFRAPKLGFLGLFFFATLAPTSSIMPVMDIAQERRMYLPLAALVTLAVICVVRSGFWVRTQHTAHSLPRPERGTQHVLAPRRFSDSPVLRFVLLFLLLAASIALGTLTHFRNRVYHTELALWLDTIDKRPNNAPAAVTAGAVLMEQGNLEGALMFLDRAVRLKPDYPMAYGNRALAYERYGDFDAAMRDYNTALTFKEFGSFYFYNNRGNLWMKLGDTARALEDFSTAIRIEPLYSRAYQNRGNIYAQQGRFPEALDDLSRAAELAPERPLIYADRGNIRAQLGMHAEAIADFSRAIALGHRNANLYYNCANSRVLVGEMDQALDDYSTALRLNPQMGEALNNRASLLYMMGQLDRARQDLTTCLQLGYTPNSNLVDMLSTPVAPPLQSLPR